MSLSTALDKSTGKGEPSKQTTGGDLANQSQVSGTNPGSLSLPIDDGNPSTRSEQKHPRAGARDHHQLPGERNQQNVGGAPSSALQGVDDRRISLKSANQRAASIAVDGHHLGTMNKLNLGMTQGRFGGKAGPRGGAGGAAGLGGEKDNGAGNLTAREQWAGG